MRTNGPLCSFATAQPGSRGERWVPRGAPPASAREETAEDTMTTTPGNASSNLPGKLPVVDLATWQAARAELLVREKARTRAGDATRSVCAA